MSDQRSHLAAEPGVQRSLSRKTLPVLLPHVRLWNWFLQSGRKLVQGWWAWELIAATLSITATMGLIAVLAWVDQHEQLTWSIGGTHLTINTVVAAIGTIMRSSLLLVVAGALNQSAWNWFAPRTKEVETKGRPLSDLPVFSEAAASSWNSMKLLWLTKGRYIASIGALIMILSIAFDTFVQQVLAIETQIRNVKLSGRNLTANNILPYTRTHIYSLDEVAGMGMSTITLSMESLITGSLSEAKTTLPHADCPTGICTWPVTPTLGICSECAAVDATVITTALNSTCNSTTYTLPPLTGLPSIRNSSLTSLACEDFKEGKWKLESVRALYRPEDAQYVTRNSTLVETYSFGTSGDPQKYMQFKDEAQLPFFAYKCSLYYCVQGFSATSSQGKTSQQPASIIADKSHWVRDNNGLSWGIFNNVPPELNAGPGSVFNTSVGAQTLFGWHLARLLNATTEFKLYTNGTVESVRASDTSLGGLFWSASGASLANVTARFQAISESVTTFIRTTTGSKDPLPPEEWSRLAPIVGVSVPIVRVRWAWLAYPLTLLLSSLAFLGMTMLATHRRVVRPWKGHPLPLLLAELDESVRAQAQGGLTNRTGLDDRIGALHVRLDFDNNDGIVFRRVHDSVTEPLKPSSYEEMSRLSS